jgi:hypothetical protein
MNPVVPRALILAAELLVFFIMTAFTSYFISHASAWQHGEGEAPPAQFPVIAYDGDRSSPEPRNYFVVPLSEWKETAVKRPGATLLLPERAARMKIGDAGEASFTVSDETASTQSVELSWRTGAGEHVARYVARAEGVEPRYLRMLGTNTFLAGAVIGFLAGVLAGRALRRRWVARPVYASAPPQKQG